MTTKLAKPQRTCGACDKPIRTQVAICRNCEDAARTLLANQASLRAELYTEYLRQTRKIEQIDYHVGRLVWPILYAEDAARLLRRQQSWLASWVAVAARLRNTGLPDIATEKRSAFIASSLPALRRKTEAAQLVNELRKLSLEMATLIDVHEMRTRFAAGPCPQGAADTACAGTVEALVRRDSPASLWCNTCHAQWDTTQWTTAGRLILRRRDELKRQAVLAQQIAKKAAA